MHVAYNLPRMTASIVYLAALLVGPGGSFGQTASNSSADSPCTPKILVDVWTHHNDLGRTGANLQETCLMPLNVNSKTFGRLFSLTVTGQIYAQPLVITDLKIKDKMRNVVYVATMENHVYAFDADGGDALPLWDRHLGAPMPKERMPKDAGAASGNYNIEPVVGITSTPVIDRAGEGGKIFVVAKIAEPSLGCEKEVSTANCPILYKIFALDLISGSTLDSQEITLPPPELQREACFWDSRLTTPWDAARINLQRPALLLSRGRIYIGFGSHQDAPCPMYHGMLISFDTDPLKQREPTFRVTQPGGIGKGGIWQAGNGPAADEDGNVYVMTGNGAFDKDRQFGSSFVKFNAALNENGWFAPANEKQLNSDILDIDLGSSGPVLLPGTEQIVGGGKEGKLYLVDRSHPGGLQKHGWPHDHLHPPEQFFWAARRWSPGPYSWFLPTFATGYHHIHGAPAFWGEPGPDKKLSHGMLYVWPERDRVKAFAYNNGKFITKPVAVGPEAGHGMPGAMLSISADHMQNGILWAALPLHDDAWIRIVRGSLRAFKASPDGTTLTQLWTSYCAEPDDYFDFAKYVPPTVANGKVYLATFSGRLNVYGLLPPDRLRDGNARNADCKISEFTRAPSYRRTNRPH